MLVDFVDQHNYKNMDKWVPLCCTVVIDHVIVMDVLYLTLMIYNTKNDSELRRVFSYK